MADLQREIAQKRREIAHHLKDLASLYRELGHSYEPEDSYTYSLGVQERQTEFLEARATFEEAERSYEQIAGYIRQIEDRSRKIGEIEADIASLAKEEELVFSQVGAMAWEAYRFNSLGERTRSLCNPIFYERRQEISKLTDTLTKQENSFVKHITALRLSRSRRKLSSLLITAGEKIVQAEWEEELGIERVDGLDEAIADVRDRRSSLTEELALHRSAVAKLKSEETASPQARLEVSRREMGEAKEVSDTYATEYGKALYEELGNRSEAAAYPLMLQIALHRSRIKKLEQEIRELGNRIKAEELRAQVLVEGRRITHLHAQMEGIRTQILQLEAGILEKQQRIERLLAKESESFDE